MAVLSFSDALGPHAPEKKRGLYHPGDPKAIARAPQPPSKT
jgi:hypothetical protein